MAIYGAATYGEDYYGDARTGENLLWSIQIDWAGTGYTGRNEAKNVTYLRIERGRDHFLNRDGNGFQRYSPGRATIYLDNDDGTYNAFNQGSELYPYVRPGVFARLGVKDKDADTFHELMRGKVEDIQPFRQADRNLVKIEIIDGQRFLEGRNVRLPFRRSPDNPLGGTPNFLMTYGAYADSILQVAGWPDGEWPRTYDVDLDYQGWESPGYTEHYYGWLEYGFFWDRDGLDALRELEEAELGTFLHARDGRARFLSKRFTRDKIVAITEEQCLRDITIPQPWEVIRNLVRITDHQVERHESGAVTVWKVGGTGNSAIRLIDGQTKTFEARFRWDEFAPVVPYNLAWTVTVNTQPDGSGTDISSQFTPEFVGVPELPSYWYINNQYGEGATVRLTNNSGSDGWILNLELTGYVYYIPWPTPVGASATSSVALYGQRLLRLASPWRQEWESCIEDSAWLLDNLKAPLQFPVIKLEHRPDLQFGLDLYVDVIHLQADTFDIDWTYRIGKIVHEWTNETGQFVRTTLRLEPYYAYGMPVELDTDLFAPFADAAEVDCSGSTADIEWCRTGNCFHQSGSWLNGSQGYVSFSTQPASNAVLASTGLAYEIPPGGAMTYWAYWFNTDNDPPGSEAIKIELETAQGDMMTLWQPFEVVQNGMFKPYAIDLSAWAGKTLDLIRFTKVSTFTSAEAGSFGLNDLRLGKVIGGTL